MDPQWKTILRFITSNLLAGSTYQQYQQKFLSPQQVKLPKTQLVRDLEMLCEKNGGFLTFAELFQEELYGTHGYYATKSQTVLTNTPPRWAEPIFLLCQQYGYHFFGELGPGNGELALRVLLLAQKASYDLTWGGVEIATELIKAIQKNFAKQHLEKKISFLVSDPDKMQASHPGLFIFPYSLDSISPEVFINTSATQSYPTATMGVTIRNGVLTEIILSPEQLKKKHIRLENGIYTDAHISLDLSSWRLSPMQRMYVAPEVFNAIQSVCHTLPAGSRLLIIDELRVDKGGYRSPHLFAPRNLMRVDRDCVDLREGYTHIGQIDYYFPLPPLMSFIPALESLGISVAFSGSEYHTAEYMTKEKSLPEKSMYENAFAQCVLTQPLTKKSKSNVIHLPFTDKIAKSWLEH